MASPGATTQGSGPDDETRRHYAGLIVAQMRSQSDQENRYVVVNAALAAVLLALAFGLVGTDTKLEISGISFSLDLSTLLTAGSLLSAGLVVVVMGLDQHLNELAAEFWRIYKPLGQYEPDSRLSPVGTYTIAESVFPANSRSWLLAVFPLVFVVLITALLPIGAQIAVAVKVADTVGWLDWPLALFVLPVVSMSSIVGLAVND